MEYDNYVQQNQDKRTCPQNKQVECAILTTELDIIDSSLLSYINWYFSMF